MWAFSAFLSLVLGAVLAGAPVADAPSAGFPVASPNVAGAHAADSGDVDTLERAEEVLSALQERYQLLDGVTVRTGETPEGREAVAYYTRGEIVINPEHALPVESIMHHEIWHIIDWRDNGRLDWGESVPPANAADFRK